MSKKDKEDDRKLEYIELNKAKWTIRFHNESGEVIEIKSKDKAMPELEDAFRGLKAFAVDGAPHLAQEYHQHTEVSALSFDWKTKNRRNGVLHFDTKVGGGGFIPGRTTKMLADSESAERKKGVWTFEAIKAFDAVEKFALEYVDGKRSQQKMHLVKDDGGNKQGKMKLDEEKIETAAGKVKEKGDDKKAGLAAVH